jgi:DNA-binding NarL/FixJ family response regulator
MTARRIRIALVDLQGVRLGIVERVISAQSDMEIVMGVGQIGELDAIAAAEADVVILGREEPSFAARLLGARPNLKVLAVATDGRQAVLYELRPQRVDLGEISPQKLVAVIRETTKAADTWPAASLVPGQATEP